MSRHQDWGKDTRQRIAIEAARLMAEEGIDGFQTAKKKAASRLAVSDRHAMPSNADIEHELRSYQQLFRSDAQPTALLKLRQGAFSAMRFLDRFKPRLVGPVLEGTADQHSHIRLHVFAETSEELAFFLMEAGIPYENSEVRLRINSHERRLLPVYNFLADGVPVELIVFEPEGLRQAPLSPVDKKPMRRADLASVRLLIDESDAA